MKNVIRLTSVIVLSFISGWFLMDYLTVHPLKMSRFLLFSLVSVFLLGILIFQKNSKINKWIGILVAIVLFLFGYFLNAKIFFNQEDSRFIPKLTRSETDSVPGHIAIIYFTHGEPETFNPIGWINQFNEFDNQGIAFVPFMFRPFFIYMLRNKYLEVGKSNHRQVHGEMFNSLKDLYRLEGDSTTHFYLCFLDDEPRPDAAVINALNDGAGRIIVANIFLTISNHTAEGQHLIEEVDTERFGIEIEFTKPMYSSKTLKSAFVEKVEACREGTPKDKIAVAFIGHGQPDEWDVEWATETNQEMGFREDLMTLFTENGYKRENMGSAWMAFKEPKPAVLMEDFVNNGVSKIFYFSAAISADAIHSQFDIPHLVHEYNFPENIQVENMGAWDNHPTVIRAFKERIDEIKNAE